MTPHEGQSRNIVAYVAPFVAYVGLTSIESNGWFGVGYEGFYTLKALSCAALLWIYRDRYPAFSTKGFGLATIVGTVGVVGWIALARLQTMIPGLQPLIESVMERGTGYDPSAAEGSAAMRMAFIAVRLTGLAVVVPLMEEIFWRGFLARYLISEDFRNVPQGQFTRFSFIVVTLAFASVHPELLAAIAWGAMVNWLYHKTANVWACVVVHAVTNGLLGAYVLASGRWELW